MPRTTPIQALRTRKAKIAASTSPTQLFAAADGTSPVDYVLPEAALGRAIWNDSTARLVIEEGTQSDLATYGGAVAIAAGGYYEMPSGYVGEVWGIWDTANGFAKTTEYI